jgi:hypothetical protein
MPPKPKTDLKGRKVGRALKDVPLPPGKLGREGLALKHPEVAEV